MKAHPHAADLSSMLAAAGLPSPPLPDQMVRTMQAQGPGCFASRSMQSEWRTDARLRDIVLRWLDAGCTEIGARCEFTGQGFHSQFVQVVFESPYCAVFVSKLASQSFDDAPTNLLRIEGSFGLMRALVDEIEEERAWPAGKRLVVVDDDREGLLYWGWVVDRGAVWDDMDLDEAGWISAVLSVKALNGRQA